MTFWLNHYCLTMPALLPDNAWNGWTVKITYELIENVSNAIGLSSVGWSMPVLGALLAEVTPTAEMTRTAIRTQNLPIKYSFQELRSLSRCHLTALDVSPLVLENALYALWGAAYYAEQDHVAGFTYTQQFKFEHKVGVTPTLTLVPAPQRSIGAALNRTATDTYTLKIEFTPPTPAT